VVRWSMTQARAIIAVVVAIGIAALTPAGAQTQNSFGLPRFNQAIASYMAIRHEVENRVGVPYVSPNATDIETMQTALARGIREARPHAKIGDIFNGVGFEFSRRIASALDWRATESGWITDRRQAVRRSCGLTVNGSFDWRYGEVLPTAVTDVLPEVPWPLQYRLLCRDLVLLDVDASLVVDVLPDALGDY
jgi:hypothetical protein